MSKFDDDGPELVAVSQYERSSGVKVGEYKRAPPGAAAAATPKKREHDEEEVAEPKKKNDEKPAKTDKKTKKDAAAAADKKEDEDTAAPPAEEKKAADAQKQPQKRGLTVQEYLQLDLRRMQEEITRRAVGNDPTLNDLAKKDADARIKREGEDAANTAWAEKGGEKPGFKELDDAIVTHCRENGWNANARSVVQNMRNHRYFDDGEFGPKSLVPHLQSAGLFAIAKEVMANKFVLQ